MPRNMRTLFRRSALACWTAILALVLAVAVLPNASARPAANHLQVVDPGTELGLEKAAAIKLTEPTPSPLPPSAPPPPGRLVIAAIGVNAPVVPVTVDSQGAMGVPTHSWEVGWFSPGVVPGYAGDAVIDGHLDWYDTSQAVFYNLKSLRPGDDIELQRLDGVTKHFTVTGVHNVAYNASVPGLFAGGGAPRLSLITCGGPWDQRLGEYLQRVIVDSTLVS